MVRDLEDVIKCSVARTPLMAGDVVVDIGCNDGTMLDFYPDSVFKVGYDPALNLAEYAENKCDKFVNDYFNAHSYTESKKAKIITSIAMFYDLDDPSAFIKDIQKVLDEEGMWVIQMMDLQGMVETNGFDNVCFEHLIYYSIKDMVSLLGTHGMTVKEIEKNKVNGGSIRLYIGFAETSPMVTTPSVQDHLEAEKKFFEENPVKSFWKQVEKSCAGIKRMVQDEADKGPIYVLGASTKGNTLLQMCGLDKHTIDKACEVNPDKYGLRTPGTNIPIISEEEALAEPPKAFLLLPWHFSEMIIEKFKDYLDNGGRIVVPLPTPKIVTKESK